ncbi:MAG: hypothetical protein VYA86_03585 [Candidatus Thermoplasmatota archaeon]|nr:hypothetical protein [Candidatus Thermoplasmatota archaeon]
MAETKDAWWGPVALLMLLIAIGMDLLVWQLSGGADISNIIEQVILGFVLAFGLTCFVLMVVSIGSAHQHSQWGMQIGGLLLLASLGIFLANSQLNGSLENMRENGVILLSGLTAMLAALGLVFGLLLALVTGREYAADPLLEMESTSGDVAIDVIE